ncbi:uncharacterized protein WCC33_005073 [Rhinophrynus dorsalis]
MADSPLIDVQIVSATDEDYEEVMSISGGIYKGMDYLPFRYHAWMRDPQRKMFLVRSEGKVVAFESFLLVDGGVTAVVEGLRVAPWVRGRGVAGIIQKFCFDTLRSDHPEVTKVRLTRAEDPPSSMMEKYRLVHSKAVVSVIFPGDQLEEILRMLEHRVSSACGGTHNVPSVLSPAEVLHLFEGPGKGEGLLPGGLFIQGWLPLFSHKSNLELLLGRGLHWLYSEPYDVRSDVVDSSALYDVTHVRSTNIIDSPNNLCDLTAPATTCSLPPSSNPALPTCSSSSGFLSLGTPPFPVPLGDGMHRLDIDMFGIDPNFAKVHVLHHLRNAVQLLPPGGGFVCFMYAEQNLRAELMHLCQGLIPFQLVAFTSFLLVDGGITAVVEGLRVAPWGRGRGIAGIIQKFCFDTLHSDHPEVTKVCLTRVEDPPSSMMEKYRLIHSKAVVSVIFPGDQLEEILRMLEHRVSSTCGGTPHVPSVLSPAEVLHLFEEPGKREGLLPGGLFIQSWLPLSFHKSNLELLLGRGLHWLYSEPCDVTSNVVDSSVFYDVTHVRSTHIIDSPNNLCDLTAPTTTSSFPPSSNPALPTCSSSSGFLSLGTPPFPVPLGDGMHCLDIDMFGIAPNFAQVHVLHHLKNAVQLLPPGGGFVCFMYAEENLRAELMHLCQGLIPFQLAREQLVLETDI